MTTRTEPAAALPLSPTSDSASPPSEQGPRYLPGHGHADILSLEWSTGSRRVLVDQGTYQYAAGPRRRTSRSTLSHNTVRINYRRHDIADNTGRLENWASLPANAPGFTYFAADSDAYASQNADHRRAVLFLRPAQGVKRGGTRRPGPTTIDAFMELSRYGDNRTAGS